MGESIGILDLDLISAYSRVYLRFQVSRADVSPVKSRTTSKPSPLPFKSDEFHVLGGVKISR